MGNRIFLGNLQWDVREADISSLLDDVGVEHFEVAVIMDRETGRSKGIAFVTLREGTESNEAVGKIDGVMLKGRPVKAEEARDRERRGADGGRRQDRRGGRPRGGGGGRRRDRDRDWG
jgi:cold-inducible RNA-binding protein